MEKGIAICDAEDYEIVKNVDGDWYLTCSGYPRVNKKGINKNNYVDLHQLLNPGWSRTDHINGNPLDNRRVNLRECTHQQNMHNRKKNKNSKSRYKGVWWEKDARKWRAAIRLDNKRYHIGYFHDERAAALAYDKKAIEFFGEFARLNFPSSQIKPSKLRLVVHEHLKAWCV